MTCVSHQAPLCTFYKGILKRWRPWHQADYVTKVDKNQDKRRESRLWSQSSGFSSDCGYQASEWKHCTFRPLSTTVYHLWCGNRFAPLPQQISCLNGDLLAWINLKSEPCCELTKGYMFHIQYVNAVLALYCDLGVTLKPYVTRQYSSWLVRLSFMWS